MYDEELPVTGIGAFTVGGVVFDAPWLILVGFVLVALGLLILSLLSKKAA